MKVRVRSISVDGWIVETRFLLIWWPDKVFAFSKDEALKYADRLANPEIIEMKKLP